MLVTVTALDVTVRDVLDSTVNCVVLITLSIIRAPLSALAPPVNVNVPTVFGINGTGELCVTVIVFAD